MNMEFVSLLISHREPMWGSSGGAPARPKDEHQEINEYAISHFVPELGLKSTNWQDMSKSV